MTTDYLHGIEVVQINDGIRPIQTVRSSVIGVIGTAPDADADAWPINTPILLANAPRKAATLGEGGTLKDAITAIYDQAGAVVVAVRVDEGDDAAATTTNVIGDITAMTGLRTFLASESEIKVTPRILCAPGFTSDRPGGDANPVVAKLKIIAERLRAIVIADGPNTTDTAAKTYRDDWGSDRIYIVDPHVKVWDSSTNAAVIQPASARVAGLIARMDAEHGFWHSPSNQIINGIVGIARPIPFALSDKNSAANLLNENEITTIVQRDGYRLWGNRTTTSDPLWAFLSVRRTADMIYESIEQNHLWAMDKPMSANLIIDVREGVSAYLRHLKALGAILGGRCWLDEELNTPTSLKAGKLYLDFDIEPPAPLERLTFRAHREDGYYRELVAQVQAA
ncbi:MAG: phage tail sheath subtilisin-like domain-containing protein [Pseudomonadota bacterium]